MVYQMIDGKVVTSEGCEVNIAYHCNLRCASCSHLSPMFQRSFADPERVREDLTTLARSFRASYVKVLGGEPLLHPQLSRILDAIRASGLAPEILLCTNGALLHRMPRRVWQQLDTVEVSTYPGYDLSQDRMSVVQEMATAYGVTIRQRFYSHFRYSYSEVGSTDDELINRIYSTCQIAHVWRCSTVFDGYFFKCPQSIFLPEILGGADNPKIDGLRLSREPHFAHQLYDYLNETTPLTACQRCLGSAGRRLAHTQILRRQWRETQMKGSEQLIDWEHLANLESQPSLDDGCATQFRSIWLERLGNSRAGNAKAASPSDAMEVTRVVDEDKP